MSDLLKTYNAARAQVRALEQDVRKFILSEIVKDVGEDKAVERRINSKCFVVKFSTLKARGSWSPHDYDVPAQQRRIQNLLSTLPLHKMMLKLVWMYDYKSIPRTNEYKTYNSDRMSPLVEALITNIFNVFGQDEIDFYRGKNEAKLKAEIEKYEKYSKLKN